VARYLSNFRTFDRETGFLLPPSVDDWLPERHLARFIVEVIDGLDLSAMSRRHGVGLVPSGSAAGHSGVRLCDAGFLQPEAGAGDVRFCGVPLHCGERPSRPRHDRHVSAAISQGDRRAVRARHWRARWGCSRWAPHYPPGTSKWNKIEHRLFCHITQTWRGRPLVDRTAVVELIAAMTTKTGLKVESALDTATYEKGIKVSNAEMRNVFQQLYV